MYIVLDLCEISHFTNNERKMKPAKIQNKKFRSRAAAARHVLKAKIFTPTGFQHGDYSALARELGISPQAIHHEKRKILDELNKQLNRRKLSN